MSALSCNQECSPCLFLHFYSHLSNRRGGWNKRGKRAGGAKVAKLINVEVGINVEGVQNLPNH